MDKETAKRINKAMANIRARARKAGMYDVLVIIDDVTEALIEELTK